MGNHKKKPLQIFNQSSSRYSTKMMSKIVSMMTLVSSLSASPVNVESTKGAPPSPSWISMGQCRATAGVLTALELSGATWTAPTPAHVKTSSSVPGSQTTPGHTRHAPLLSPWWWLQLLPLLPSLPPSQSSPPTHQFQPMFQPTLTRFQLMLMFQSSLELSHLDL